MDNVFGHGDENCVRRMTCGDWAAAIRVDTICTTVIIAVVGKSGNPASFFQPGQGRCRTRRKKADEEGLASRSFTDWKRHVSRRIAARSPSGMGAADAGKTEEGD